MEAAFFSVGRNGSGTDRSPSFLSDGMPKDREYSPGYGSGSQGQHDIVERGNPCGTRAL